MSFAAAFAAWLYCVPRSHFKAEMGVFLILFCMKKEKSEKQQNQRDSATSVPHKALLDWKHTKNGDFIGTT